MHVQIRLAKVDELKTIQDLNYQLFEHDQIYDPLLNMKWPYEAEGTHYFNDRISGKEGVCLVAEVDGKVVGYLAGAMVKPYSYRTVQKQSELENTLVLEEFRGHRVGEQLFRAFVDWSRKQGAERVKVDAAAENSGAIRFYHRIGFEDYGRELEFPIS